jgi:hypothetical protein
MGLDFFGTMTFELITLKNDFDGITLVSPTTLVAVLGVEVKAVTKDLVEVV